MVFQRNEYRLTNTFPRMASSHWGVAHSESSVKDADHWFYLLFVGRPSWLHWVADGYYDLTRSH